MLSHRVLFAYHCVTTRSSQLLLAVPPSTAWQVLCRTSEEGVKPEATILAGPNVAQLYTLERGQSVLQEYRCELTRGSGLEEHVADGYLRESPLVDFGAEVQQLARSCERSEFRQTLKALYDTLVKKTTYHWPPKQRGASSFLRSWTGDCGEMAFAMVAACRYLGLKARVALGAFAQPGLNAHAWVEVYYDNRWRVIDPALGNADQDNATLWFDFAPSDRVVFSYDCDLLVRGLQEPRGKTNVEVMMGERSFYWGASLLNGGVPYLQPGYPLIGEIMQTSMTFPVWDISVEAMANPDDLIARPDKQ